MAIKTSSLPRISEVFDTTLIVGVEMDNETPNNTITVTCANLKTYATQSVFLKANQSFIKANACYSFANSTANTANSSAVYANGAFIQANACFQLSNTNQSDIITTQSNLSGLSVYASYVHQHSNVVFDSTNTAITRSTSSFTKANSAYDKANSAYDYATNIDDELTGTAIAANDAIEIAFSANTNAVVAYGLAEQAVSDSQSADANASLALYSANNALSLSGNTALMSQQIYNKANTTDDTLTTYISTPSMVNVLRNGVKVDGTDTTTEIQTLIDNSIDSSTLFFPSGDYVITSVSLRPGIKLIGSGVNSTRFIASQANSNMIVNEINPDFYKKLSSYNDVLIPNNVDGTFGTNNGWTIDTTAGGDITISGGALTYAAALSGSYIRTTPDILTEGTSYRISFLVSNYVEGELFVVYNTSTSWGSSISSDGFYSEVLMAPESGYLSFYCSEQTSLQIDNIIVEEIVNYPYKDHIEISDICFDSNQIANCSAMVLSGNNTTDVVTNIKIKDVRISGNGTYFDSGISISNCRNFSINSNYFNNTNLDVIIEDSFKGIVVNNVSDSNVAVNMIESTNSDYNMFMGNILYGRIDSIGTNTIEVNNIQEIGE